MITILITPETDGHFVKVQSDDPSDFQTAIDTLKSFIPAHRRKYVPRLRQWFIAQEAEEATGRWLNYCCQHLQAEVDVDRTHKSASANERQPKVSDPYTTLHLLPSAPPELVRSAYKCLATLYHPDKPTGDVEKMKALNNAFDQLRQIAA